MPFQEEPPPHPPLCLKQAEEKTSREEELEGIGKGGAKG